MYQTGDLIITKSQEVLLVLETQEPDGSEFHNMLVFDIIATIEEDYDDEDLEDYIDWLINQPWYRYYHAGYAEEFWDCEAFMDIEKKV